MNRIYLDELEEITSLGVGIATIKLIIEDENTAIVAARDLIARTQQQIGNEPQQRQLSKSAQINRTILQSVNYF